MFAGEGVSSVSDKPAEDKIKKQCEQATEKLEHEQNDDELEQAKKEWHESLKGASIPCGDRAVEAYALCKNVNRRANRKACEAYLENVTSTFKLPSALDSTKDEQLNVASEIDRLNQECIAKMKSCMSTCGPDASGLDKPTKVVHQGVYQQCSSLQSLVSKNDQAAKLARRGGNKTNPDDMKDPGLASRTPADKDPGVGDPAPTGAETPPSGDPPSSPGGEPSQQASPGGGGAGIGQLLSSLAPLALMAAMMGGDEDQVPPNQEDPLEKFCAENPNSQVCVTGVDCTNKEVAALNPGECLCKDPETARSNPICNQNGGAPVGAGGSFAALGSDGRDALLNSDIQSLLGGAGGDPQAVQGENPSVDANQKGGGGAGPSASGGGFGSGAPSGGGGYGPGPHNTDILKGVGKGGGGSGGVAGGGGGYNYNSGSGNYSDDGSGFDLSQFLPDKKPSRAVAGMTLTKTDGLTGPFGPSIWEKVSQRYRKKQPFLKP